MYCRYPHVLSCIWSYSFANRRRCAIYCVGEGGRNLEMPPNHFSVLYAKVGPTDGPGFQRM